MKIWVDDIRTPPDETWLWFKDSFMAMQFLMAAHRQNFPIDLISLDHDLGGDDTTRPIIMAFCRWDWWPLEVRIHTANPVGREWLEGMIERYKP